MKNSHQISLCRVLGQNKSDMLNQKPTHAIFHSRSYVNYKLFHTFVTRFNAPEICNILQSESSDATVFTYFRIYNSSQYLIFTKKPQEDLYLLLTILHSKIGFLLCLNPWVLLNEVSEWSNFIVFSFGCY